MEIATLVVIFLSGSLVSLPGTPYIPLLGNPLNNQDIHLKNMGTN